jgi:hypothetical protein
MRELIVTSLIVGLVGLGMPAVSQVRAQQYEPNGNISGIAFRAPCVADDDDTLIALEHLPEEEDEERLRGAREIRLADPDFLLGSTEPGSEDEVTVVRQWRYNDDEDTDDHNPLEDHRVRLRNLNTGELVRLRDPNTGTLETRTTTSGDFLFTGLAPATYMVEVVDDDGTVIATSDSTLRLVEGAMTITDAWAPLPGCGGAAWLIPVLAGLGAAITAGIVTGGPPASPSQ